MTSCTRSRRNSGASAAVSGVSGRSRSNGVREQGQPRDAARGTAARPSARSRSAISLGRGGLRQPEHVVEQPPERCVRRRGLVRVARDRERRAGRRRGWRSSSTRRLFPIPGIADELDQAARARRAGPRCPSVNAAISASRPTSGRLVDAGLDPALRGADRERVDRMTLALHVERLERRRSRTTRASGRAPSAVARIWPGSARAMSRAGEVHRVAHDGVGPAVARARRRRRRSGRGARRCGRRAGASRRRCGAGSASIRSSSSPIARGTPATRMILPPSWSMSVPRNVTSCSSAARCTSVDELVERVGDAAAVLRVRAARRCRRSAGTRRWPGGARGPRHRRAGGRGSRWGRSPRDRRRGRIGGTVMSRPGVGQAPDAPEPEARTLRLADDVGRERRRGGRAHDDLARGRAAFHVGERADLRRR